MQMKTLILASVLGAGALGCGDDDGGGGGSGVSSSKKVNELSDAEFKSVCQNLENKFQGVDEASSEALCTLEGIIEESTTDGDCEEVRDMCVEELEDEEPTSLDCDEPPDSVMDDCDATVGEFEACVNAIVKAFDGWAGQITCSTEVAELEEFDGEGPEEPAACAKLDDACGLRGAFEAEGVEND